MTSVRLLKAKDFPDWLPLWDANNMGQRNEAVTTETWARLTTADFPVHGLGAWKNDRLAGILHYIVHPVTGSVNPVCYMQDLFVDPSCRNQGFAKALLKELERTGKREQWNRIYWLAENGNEAAQGLYKSIGVKLDFSLHVLPVS